MVYRRVFGFLLLSYRNLALILCFLTLIWLVMTMYGFILFCYFFVLRFDFIFFWKSLFDMLDVRNVSLILSNEDYMNFNEFFCLKYTYLFLLIPELYQYALLGALDQKSGDFFFLFFSSLGNMLDSTVE